MSDDFVRDLERELVAAARFRAARHRPVLPRPRSRGVLAGAAVVALACAAVLLVLGRSDPDTPGDERLAPPRPPTGAVATLVPLFPAVACRDVEVRREPAAPALADVLGVLERPERPDDSALAPSRDGRVGLPVATFDPREVRLAGYGRLGTTVRVVPTLGVSTGGGCGATDEPGACLVDGAGGWRCFTTADIRAGRALARTDEGTALGLVPDGVARVTLSAAAASVAAEVVDNVFEARLDAPAGARVEITFTRAGDDGCRRGIAPGLRDRVGALTQLSSGLLLPLAARDLLRDWEWQLDAVVESGARLWGGGDGVEFWVVPVVPRGRAACAPADRVCVVAVPERLAADAHCEPAPNGDEPSWRLSSLLPGNAAIYGVVPDGVTGARLTLDAATTEVDASGNVLAGVLPVPYGDGAEIRIEYLESPVVGVVDAGGDAATVARKLRAGGFRTLVEITPGVTPQPPTVVHWRPGQATRQDAERVAELLAADAVQEIVGVERQPRPIQDTRAPIVVVAGSG